MIPTNPYQPRPGENVVEYSRSSCVSPYLYVRAAVVASREPFGGTTYSVAFVWTDTRYPLDRPHSHSISTGTDLTLARRLAALAGAGLVHERDSAKVRRDVNGRSYVEARCLVSGRHLRADLNALPGVVSA